MNSRPRIRRPIYLGLVMLAFFSVPQTTAADGAGEAAAQQTPGQVRPIRRLGGSTRFTPPVNTVGALQKTMSQPRIQRDIATVLEQAGMTSVTGEVQKALAGGMVNETTAPTGTTFEWMAL